MPADPVRAFLADRHAEVLELALWVRDVVRDAEPDFTERIYTGWDGVGFHHPDAGYVCAIYPRAGEHAVRLLFEHGATLADPDRILEGTGRRTRHIRITDRARAEQIARYVQDAVARRLLR